MVFKNFYDFDNSLSPTSVENVNYFKVRINFIILKKNRGYEFPVFSVTDVVKSTKDFLFHSHFCFQLKSWTYIFILKSLNKTRRSICHLLE